MSARPERPLSHVRLAGLDTLRGVAILAVLVHNLSTLDEPRTLAEKAWNTIAQSGWAGVQLFFVLSGFLITGILVDDRERPRFVRAFYGRRALRIFPLYYLLLASIFVAQRIAPEVAVPARQAPWLVLYLSNWSFIAYGLLDGLGHTWSLAVEEQFYLAWPWVVAATRPRSLAWVCVTIVAGSLAARVALRAAHVSDLWLYASTITRADALALGGLVALAVRSETWRPRLAQMMAPVAGFTIVSLGALVAVTHGLGRSHPLVQVYGYSLVAIGSAVLVAKMARPRDVALPGEGALRFFGKYSYALYVVHVPLKYFVVRALRPTLASWQVARPLATELGLMAALTSASVIVALFSWVTIERPLLSLKDRFAPR